MSEGTLWAVELFTATVKERMDWLERQVERLEDQVVRYRQLAGRAHDDTGECSGDGCLFCRQLVEAGRCDE